jgi:hypothetical protein
MIPKLTIHHRAKKKKVVNCLKISDINYFILLKNIKLLLGWAVDGGFIFVNSTLRRVLPFSFHSNMPLSMPKFYKYARIYDLINWAKAVFSTAYLAWLLFQDSVHKYLRLYKNRLYVYRYFLSIAICQLIESWMGVLVVYTQAHRC